MGPGAHVRAQNIIETDLGTQDPSVLVQALLGSGVVFSNVTYLGTTGSAGTFTGGNGIIGFDSGIILSTGLAASVVGPNDSNICSTNNGTVGDADLTALAGGVETYDATILSFDFIPTYNTISFQYVFSSEEYNEFVDSDYNDVFGFFLNGTNVALIPGTICRVINRRSPLVNSSYFIDNIGEEGGGCLLTVPSANLNTSMNGLTTVLTVNAAVLPGVTNHIKLAIADVSRQLDLNVFHPRQQFCHAAHSPPTPSITPTGTLTETPTVTDTPTNTFTPTITLTFTPTPTPTQTPTPSTTTTPTDTATPTITSTHTATPTHTCEIHAWPDPFNPGQAVWGMFKVGCRGQERS